MGDEVPRNRDDPLVGQPVVIVQEGFDRVEAVLDQAERAGREGCRRVDRRELDVVEDLSAQIALKSDGNPFFVFEILRGLREGRFITRSDSGAWVSTTSIDEVEIPSSILDLINARVSGLTQDERDAHLQLHDHPHYAAAIRFTERWDQCSFDPDHDTLPLEHFEPVLRRVLTRKPCAPTDREA